MIMRKSDKKTLSVFKADAKKRQEVYKMGDTYKDY